MDIHGSLLAKTQAYLSALSWGVPAILFYQVIRSYCEGFGKTRPIMKIGILALLCNIPLNYIFIYGKLGLPAMGGVGCGWASAIVMWIMAIASSLYISKSELFKPIKLFNQWQNPQRKPLGSILRLGIPIGFTLLIEVSMFSVIALLVARLGEVVVAAHQITISFTGMIFMLPEYCHGDYDPGWPATGAKTVKEQDSLRPQACCSPAAFRWFPAALCI